jgi:alpha-galactosidase
MDDCWQWSRDAQGTIQPEPAMFPSGIPALADYVHSKKLKFGLYTGTKIILIIFSIYVLDRGYKTCSGRPGSLNYETKDANTFAAWGVDYLKVDSCSLDSTPEDVEYEKIRDALNATGRPIFYSLCGMYTNAWHFSISCLT